MCVLVHGSCVVPTRIRCDRKAVHLAVQVRYINRLSARLFEEKEKSPKKYPELSVPKFKPAECNACTTYFFAYCPTVSRDLFMVVPLLSEHYSLGSKLLS